MQELPWDEQMKMSEARGMGAYLEERRKLKGAREWGVTMVNKAIS